MPLAAAVIVLAMAPAAQFTGWQWMSLALAAPAAVWGAWPLHRAAASAGAATTFLTIRNLSGTPRRARRRPQPDRPACRPDCPDHEDNLILDLAVEVGALLIVSNDTDLLSMSPWRGTPVIEPAAFAAKVNAMRRHARRRHR